MSTAAVVPQNTLQYGRQPKTTMIYSVYPLKPKPVQLSWYAGFKSYEIEPAPRDGYTKCAVEDTIQWIRDTSTFSDDNTNGDLKDAPVSGRLRAIDLVNYWRSNTVGAVSGFTLGIDIFEGQEGSPEFEVFLTGLRETQKHFAQWMIQDANDKHIRGEGGNISDLHRAMAKWLLDKGAERLPWYPKIEFSDVKNCVACNAQIDKLARKCPSCQTDLVDYYLKYDLPADDDPVVFAAIERITSARAARTPGPVQAPTASATKV